MSKNKMPNLKIFYIADYLMRNTDDELDENGRPLHGALVKEIQGHLKEKGIVAEAHSISKDIDLLRGVWRGRKDEETGETEVIEFEPILDIVGGKGKPFYLGSRFFEFEDVETIAECVASANFISKREAEELIEKLKRLCSDHQAKTLTSEYLVVERPKYTQRKMLNYLRKIRYAIRNDQKITFLYTRHSPKNITVTENRRKGERFVVSPFEIVLSEGKHYLIGYDGKYHQIKPYRIDRMDDVRIKFEPSDGKEKYSKRKINDYAKQTFGMFIGGDPKPIIIQFHTDLLDAMLERFGGNAGTTKYTQIDDKHYTIKTDIVESENFYGWICGLGGKAIILEPQETAERFKLYLDKIRQSYS